jgi:FKBP-type peptidyl-prolyl cis-trans isomerase 2
MALADGDVVRFDYTLTIEGDDRPVETSMADVAQANGLLNPERRYEPLTVAMGARQIIPGLEAELRGKAKAGAGFTADIPADAAYGERDPKKMKDVPMAQFRREKVKPEVGMILNYEGQRAIVQRVAGGRVRLDLNHELAGKTLRYDVKVREVITDAAGKVDAVLKSIFNGGAPHELTDDAVTVTLPDAAKFDQNWTGHKFRLLTLLRQAVGLDHEIRLVESYPAMKPDAAGEEE